MTEQNPGSPTETTKAPRRVVGTEPCGKCGAPIKLTAGPKGRVMGTCSAPTDKLGKDGMPVKCGRTVIISEAQSRHLLAESEAKPKEESHEAPKPKPQQPAPARAPAARKPAERKPAAAPTAKPADPPRAAGKLWFE